MRRALAIVAALAALAFVVAAVALRLHSDSAPAASRSLRLAVGVAVDRHPPPIELRDASGRRTSLAALRGRWVALAPSMTLCHEVCPITTGALLRLRSELHAAGAGERFTVLEVTTDPWRDTPRRLRAFRRRTGADLEILTGSVRGVRRFWRFFGVHFSRTPVDRPVPTDWMTGRPERFDVEHTDGVFLLAPSGRERVAIAGMPGVGGHLGARLRSLLDRAGLHNLRRPRAPWTAAAVAADLRGLMGLRTPAVAAPSHAAARARLRGSPGALATLHRQAGLLIGDGGLEARLASLRGFPTVVNAWASWCPPCREELPLFASAAARFGRRVAFLGADVDDDSGAAGRLLAEVPLSYPSYGASSGEVTAALGAFQGTPVTYFLAADGSLAGTHVGAYTSLAELESDVAELLETGPSET